MTFYHFRPFDFIIRFFGLVGNVFGVCKKSCAIFDIPRRNGRIVEDFLLIDRIAMNDPLDPFCRNGIGIIFHFDQDEAALAAVFGVHIQYGVRRRARTGEAVEDDRVFICS